jgi:hypothetical protein
LFSRLFVFAPFWCFFRTVFGKFSRLYTLNSFLKDLTFNLFYQCFYPDSNRNWALTSSYKLLCISKCKAIFETRRIRTSQLKCLCNRSCIGTPGKVASA